MTGTVADRYPRRRVAALAHTSIAMATPGLAAVTWRDGAVGLGVMLVVIAVRRVWPELWNLPPLHTLTPAATAEFREA